MVLKSICEAVCLPLEGTLLYVCKRVWFFSNCSNCSHCSQFHVAGTSPSFVKNCFSELEQKLTTTLWYQWFVNTSTEQGWLPCNIIFFYKKKTKRCSTSKTLDCSCNPWTCFAWKWVPLPWLPWAFELQWKIDRIMSYLVHCALIEYSVHWLIWFTICPILIAEESKPTSATCSENYNIWFSAAGESSSLPGNLIQETRALPIGKLTRSTEIEQETPTNFFSAQTSWRGWKVLLCC